MMTVRQFGKKGRFGNQLFQYAHLRQMAGKDYECPRWAGQRLFGLTDPAPTGKALDIGVRFSHDSGWYDKRLFRRLFRPTSEKIKRIQLHIEAMRQNGPLVGVHLRRGDYGKFKRKSARWCFRAPVQWYVDWLDENLDSFDGMPQVFVASDDRDIELDGFEPYPVHKYDRGGYWWDFYTLTQCDYLLISNSTFSFAASMLNERATEFWRPRLSEKKLIPYDPKNSPIVLKDELYAV